MIICIQFTPGDPTLTYAAEELISHLSRLSLPLTFLNNETSKPHDYTILLAVSSNLKEYSLSEVAIPSLDDQYAVHFNTRSNIIKGTNSRSNIIKGTNSRSVLLGVYAYLRQIGFRFLLPGKEGTIIPDISSVQQLFCTITATASLRHRGICIEGADSIENILDFIDWLPKVGFNSFFVQFRHPYIFLERWYSHTNNPTYEKEAFTSEFLQQCYHKIDVEMKKRSLIYHGVGHGWTCEALGLPSLGWIPEDTPLSDEMNSLLAVIDNKREFFKGIPLNTNLCYSNPAAIKCFIDSVIDYVTNNTHVNYLHIWIADNINNICECEECRKTTPSDQYVHILNQIDEELTKKGFETKIVFLMYQELLYPPKIERLKNPERFTLMFAPISRTFEASYPTDVTSDKLPDYIRNEFVLPVSLEENLTFLNAWRTVFSGDSFIYDYPLGRAHYGDLGYYSITKILYDDIKTLPLLQFNGYMSCQELRCFLPNSFPNYVMGHLLFDSSISFDDIAMEYFSSAYAKDSMVALEYLKTLSSLSSCDYFNRKGDRFNLSYAANCTRILSVITEFKPIIKENLRTKNASIFWRLLDYHSQYSYLLASALKELAQNNNNSANDNYKRFLSYIQEHEKEYQPYLDVYRVNEVATNYTGFKQQ